MYTKQGQIAKTDLPCFGDNIDHIDITKDGNWILCTCKTYLLLISTVLDEDKNGFTHRMGKNKPLPIKLTLNNTDLHKYNINNIYFHNA